MTEKSTRRDTRFKIRLRLVGMMSIVLLILIQGISNLWLRAAGVTLVSISLFLMFERLVHDRQRLLRVATIDELTDLGNFRAYQERMRHETQRAQRKHAQLTLILIDLDQFKNYNDAYGHRLGNELLRSTGRAFREAVRSMDGVYRFGGDEFAVVLPETDLEEARQVAKRIRQSFELIPERASVTLSMGMALYREESLAEFFDRVDHLLYDVKAHGGNCCQSEPTGHYTQKSVSMVGM